MREAVVFGRDREHTAAILCIDGGIVGRWAESRMLTYTTYQDLAAKPEVYALVRREIEGVNAQLPAATRIRRFALLYKELDADDGELTRTRKVRRGVVEERYGPLVAGLYGPEPDMELTAEIRYQDGRSLRMSGTIRLESASG